MALWSFPTMSASFVPIVIVKDSSYLGCTTASPLVCRGAVTASRSAAKSEDVNARRSSAGFMWNQRVGTREAFGGIWLVALLAE